MSFTSRGRAPDRRLFSRGSCRRLSARSRSARPAGSSRDTRPSSKARSRAPAGRPRASARWSCGSWPSKASCLRTRNWTGEAAGCRTPCRTSSGSAYLEWLAARAGEDSLRELWRRMASRFAGGFATSFEEVFGDSPEDLYDRFVAETTERAIGEERRIQAEGLAAGELALHLEGGTSELDVSPDGTKLLARRDPTRRESYVAVWNATLGPEDPPYWKLRRQDGFSAFDPRWMPDSRRVLFSKRAPDARRRSSGAISISGTPLDGLRRPPEGPSSGSLAAQTSRRRTRRPRAISRSPCATASASPRSRASISHPARHATSPSARVRPTRGPSGASPACLPTAAASPPWSISRGAGGSESFPWTAETSARSRWAAPRCRRPRGAATARSCSCRGRGPPGFPRSVSVDPEGAVGAEGLDARDRRRSLSGALAGREAPLLSGLDRARSRRSQARTVRSGGRSAPRRLRRRAVVRPRHAARARGGGASVLGVALADRAAASQFLDRPRRRHGPDRRRRRRRARTLPLAGRRVRRQHPRAARRHRSRRLARAAGRAVGCSSSPRSRSRAARVSRRGRSSTRRGAAASSTHGGAGRSPGGRFDAELGSGAASLEALSDDERFSRALGSTRLRLAIRRTTGRWGAGLDLEATGAARRNARSLLEPVVRRGPARLDHAVRDALRRRPMGRHRRIAFAVRRVRHRGLAIDDPSAGLRPQPDREPGAAVRGPARNEVRRVPRGPRARRSADRRLRRVDARVERERGPAGSRARGRRGSASRAARSRGVRTDAHVPRRRGVDRQPGAALLDGPGIC